ncbi:hypothetical protein PCA10_07070 [Metapseudomonas resinovorans NBRC 106553]|uniref:Uncharacterized protein n=1 Tax=Metapseudomonas resinovorans NBRC 106553 TaxID=1245471 RepID=S6BBI3_METRE|nr:hypothetical protein PCA10_07070 [Pseudomonas resinovorans NBRC 106553]
MRSTCNPGNQRRQPVGAEDCGKRPGSFGWVGWLSFIGRSACLGGTVQETSISGVARSTFLTWTPSVSWGGNTLRMAAYSGDVENLAKLPQVLVSRGLERSKKELGLPFHYPTNG